MIPTYWFAFPGHSRSARTGARRSSLRASRRRASFEALEDRCLLSSVSFGTSGESETVLGNSTTFTIPVTLSGNVSTIGFDWPGPVGLACDSAGNLYVNQSDDAGTVSKVTPGGTISSFAHGFKNGTTGTAGELAFGPNGNLYVANPGANAVNEVTPGGNISTFASGTTDAYGLAFDSHGNLYWSDFANNDVFEITPSGAQGFSPLGELTGLDGPMALAFDSAGNLYVANKLGDTVWEFSSAGNLIDIIPGLNGPDALAFDSAGNLYVACGGDGTVIEAPAGGAKPTTIASGFTDPDGLAFDTDGNLYVSEFGGGGVLGTVFKYNGPVTVPFTIGGTAVANTDYSGVPTGPLTFGIGQTTQNIAGTLLPDPGPNRTLTITLGAPSGGASLGNPSENTLTIVEPPSVQFSTGNETVNESTGTFSIPVTLSITSDGEVDVPFTLGGTAVSGVDFEGITSSPLKFTPGQTTQDITGKLLSDPGPTRTLTLSLGTPQGTGFAVFGSPSVNTLAILEPAVVQFAAAGETVSESDGTFSIAVTVSDNPNGAATVSPFASGLNTPGVVAVDSAGDFYVANVGDGTVSEVSPTGKISPFASGFKLPFGEAVDAAGNLYVADTAAGTVSKVTKAGATPITVASGLNAPTGLAFDSAGNLYVASNADGTVFEVPGGSGAPLAFASGFNGPFGLAFDSAGNLYVANNVGGSVSKVPKAGGAATTFASGFNNPFGLAFDAAGNLYVADSENKTVDQVTPTGVVSTFVGGFQGATGVAFNSGRMYVTDNVNNTLDQVTQTLSVPFALGGTAVAGVAYRGVTAGVLTFGIGQTTQVITGTLLSDPGPNQTLTFTLGAPAGGAILGSPSVNTLTIAEPGGTSTPPPSSPGSSASPVFLGEQRVFLHKGKRKKLIGFEFLFNDALDQGDAQSTGNYHATQGSGRKLKALRITSAAYNPSVFSVTLSVSGFNARKPAQVVISGLAGADGAAISPITTRL